MVRHRKARRRSYSPRRWFRRHKPTAIPLLPVIPAVNAAFIQPLFGNASKGWVGAWTPIQNGNAQVAATEFIDILSMNFTGYKPSSGAFDINAPIMTYGTIILGLIGHMIANKAGVNKYMKRVPMIGKYVAL